MSIDQRAFDIYSALESGRTTAIKRFFRDKQSEELFLDFKRVSPEYKINSLGKSDEENLSAAISGFGNSCGGVIVWGVTCSGRGQKPDLPDVPIPISEVQAFKADVENAISRMTMPPHSAVQNTVILENGSDSGYLATLVPLCHDAPLRAVARKLDSYYVRAGSSFVSMNHTVLAGMFGRRPQSSLDLIIGDIKVMDASSITVDLLIQNVGGSIARDYFAILEVPPGSFEDVDLTGIEHWDYHREGKQVTLLSKLGDRLPPSSRRHLCKIRIRFTEDWRHGRNRRDCNVVARLGSEGSAPNFWTSKLSSEDLSWITSGLEGMDRNKIARGQADFSNSEKSYIRGRFQIGH